MLLLLFYCLFLMYIPMKEIPQKESSQERSIVTQPQLNFELNYSSHH